MKSKLIQIPYTIGIIKPHLVLREEQVSLPLCSQPRPSLYPSDEPSL